MLHTVRRMLLVACLRFRDLLAEHAAVDIDRAAAVDSCWKANTNESRSQDTAFREYAAVLAKLPPVPCREDLPSFAQKYFYDKGAAAEIGVFQGGFAKEYILQAWKGNYVGIDAWRHRGDGSTDMNVRFLWWHLRNMRLAQRAVASAGNRSRLIRRFSRDAVKMFVDGYFDWIYIDALHTKQGALEDLELWWPKLRHGGLFSGDDYSDVKSTEFLPAGRIGAENYKPAEEFNFGVIRATQEFSAKVGASLSVTFLNRGPNCESMPSWYMVKPPSF